MPDQEGLFIISVAARLLEMHQQTLRKYEREGFISPQRTAGKLRLYSPADIERLRQIKYLVEDLGMGLTGVEVMLELSRRLARVHAATTAGLSEEAAAQLRSELAEALALLGVAAREPARPGARTTGERRDEAAGGRRAAEMRSALR